MFVQTIESDELVHTIESNELVHTMDSATVPLQTMDSKSTGAAFVQTIEPVHTIEQPSAPVHMIESLSEGLQPIELVHTIEPDQTIEFVQTIDDPVIRIDARLALIIACFPDFPVATRSPEGDTSSPAISRSNDAFRFPGSLRATAANTFVLPTPTSKMPAPETNELAS